MKEETKDKTPVAHLAGPHVWINGRCLQRCLVCGAKLADLQNTSIQPEADDEYPDFPGWPEGQWVQVSPGNPTAYRVLSDLQGNIPESNCERLA